MMKNALILHATDCTSKDSWYLWLQKQLENAGYNVWTPNLPQANQPNIQRYNTHIFDNKDWKFIKESIIIDHSS